MLNEFWKTRRIEKAEYFYKKYEESCEKYKWKKSLLENKDLSSNIHPLDFFISSNRSIREECNISYREMQYWKKKYNKMLKKIR